MKPGDTIVISLHENPSTGFQWTFDQEGDMILASLGSTYVKPSAFGIGGGGLRSWTFNVKRDGDIHLAFKLWRAWEGSTSITERFNIEIISR